MEGKRKIPHTFVIIFGLIVIAAMSTWFIGGGEYVRTQKEMPGGGTRTVIMPDSFREVPNQPQTWQIFSALFDGFVDALCYLQRTLKTRRALPAGKDPTLGPILASLCVGDSCVPHM